MKKTFIIGEYKAREIPAIEYIYYEQRLENTEEYGKLYFFLAGAVSDLFYKRKC